METHHFITLFFPKFKIRISKSETNSKFEIKMTETCRLSAMVGVTLQRKVLNIWISVLQICSEIRISCFGFCSSYKLQLLNGVAAKAMPTIFIDWSSEAKSSFDVQRSMFDPPEADECLLAYGELDVTKCFTLSFDTPADDTVQNPRHINSGVSGHVRVRSIFKITWKHIIPSSKTHA